MFCFIIEKWREKKQLGSSPNQTSFFLSDFFQWTEKQKQVTSWAQAKYLTEGKKKKYKITLKLISNFSPETKISVFFLQCPGQSILTVLRLAGIAQSSCFNWSISAWDISTLPGVGNRKEKSEEKREKEEKRKDSFGQQLTVLVGAYCTCLPHYWLQYWKAQLHS